MNQQTLQQQNLAFPSAKSIMRDYVALMLTIILLFIIGLLLFFGYHPKAIAIESLQKLVVPWVMVRDKLTITPAPREHFIFISLLLLSPLVVIAAIIAARKIVDILRLNNFQSVWVQALLLAIPFLVIFVFHTSTFFRLLTYLPWLPFFIACALSIIIFTKFFYKNQNAIHSLTSIRKRYFILFLLVSGILQSVTWRIFDFNLVDAQRPWVLHFDAVFYSVSQVMGGKTILADLPAQYGLYGELLKPLFMVVPFSVFSFTITMAVLQIIGLLALGKVMIRIVRSPWLLLLGLLILLDMTAETWRIPLLNLNREVLQYPDFYFQYWPIRFIFPAISVWAFFKLLQRFYLRDVALLAAIGAIGVIWNIDSGIPIVGAFLFFLGCQFIFPPKPQMRIYLLKMIGVALAVTAGLWLLFFFYLSWKADQPLKLLETIAYQKTFFDLGFAKMPLPRTLHPWVIIIGCYLLGMIIAFTAWINQRHSKITGLIFYLSILGLGLFTYYQGRSHIYNLLRVFWPALLIVIILSDRFLRLVKLKRFPQFLVWLSLPIVLFGTFAAVHLLWQLPTFGQLFYRNWHSIMTHPSSVTGENIEFIKKQVRNKKSVEIMMLNQGTYYAETGLASAINGPGFIETIFQKDFDATIHQLITHPVENLFLGPTYYSPEKVQSDFNILFNYYDIKDKNINGVYYLTPKKEPSYDKSRSFSPEK